MELIATIILIIVGSALLHMDEYKSSNRILPEGYEIDRVKAIQDIQKYGKHIMALVIMALILVVSGFITDMKEVQAADNAKVIMLGVLRRPWTSRKPHKCATGTPEFRYSIRTVMVKSQKGALWQERLLHLI